MIGSKLTRGVWCHGGQDWKISGKREWLSLPNLVDKFSKIRVEKSSSKFTIRKALVTLTRSVMTQ